MSRLELFQQRLAIVRQDLELPENAVPETHQLLELTRERATLIEVLLAVFGDENREKFEGYLLHQKRFEKSQPLPAMNLNALLLQLAYVDLVSNGPRV